MAGSVWPALVAGARAKASEVEAKFDWVEGDIVPMTGGTRTDATYDLGTSSHRWRDAYVSRQLILPAGSSGTPAITEAGAANGFYFPTTSQIAATNPFLAANGSVAAPGLATVGSPTTGFYRIGADNLGLAAAGVKVMDVSAAGEITKPLQPAFMAFWDATQTTLTGSTEYTFTANWSESYDQNADFSTGVFLAPVTGKYLFTFNVFFQLDHGAGSHAYNLYTTGRTYAAPASAGVEGSIGSGGDLRDNAKSFSIVAAMTAGDRAFMTAYFSANTTTSAVSLRGYSNGGSGTPSTSSNLITFSGCLLA